MGFSVIFPVQWCIGHVWQMIYPIKVLLFRELVTKVYDWYEYELCLVHNNVNFWTKSRWMMEF